MIDEALIAGLRLRVDGDQLRAEGASKAPRELLDQIRAQKAEVIALLQEQAQAHSPARLAILVERVGKRMQFLELHKHEWDNEEWDRRLAAILIDQRELDAALKATGRKIEECGWTVTPTGFWARLGEEPARAQQTRVEQIIHDAVEQAAVIIAAREMDASGPEWEYHDNQIAAAALDDDPFEVETACREYLVFVETQASAAAVRMTPAEADAARREWVHQQSEAVGFPRLKIGDGVYVMAGKDGWGVFCRAALPVHITAAAVALRGALGLAD